MSNKLLVISPHADDAELGCGAYIAKAAGAGDEVHVTVVTTGEVYFSHLKRVVTPEERQKELAASADILGFSWNVLYRDRDTRMDAMPLRELITDLEDGIRAFEPNEILIPLPSSHQDHDVVYRACLAALRPTAWIYSVQLIAAYEYMATSWGPGSAHDASKGGLYAEIHPDDMALKLEALRAYKSQIRPDGHCWSIEAAKVMARMRGLEAGLEAAELFHVLREIRR